MRDDPPVDIAIRLGPGRGEARILLDGSDITRHCRGLRIDAGVGALADVWLDLVGVAVELEGEIPRSRIQTLTVDQAETRETTARPHLPAGNGRARSAGVQLGISLGIAPSRKT